MRIVSYLIWLSAALHLAGIALGGFGAEALKLLAPAALFALLGFLLWRGLRGVGWAALVLLLGSAAAALGNAVAPGAVPEALFAAICAVNLVAAAVVFLRLWRGRPPAEA